MYKMHSVNYIDLVSPSGKLNLSIHGKLRDIYGKCVIWNDISLRKHSIFDV